MPKVSVIIPSYNCACYLPSSIESVLEQTYRDLEILVVDDGSTDDTESVLQRFAPSVRYLKSCHKGAAAARNQGIIASDGDYIAFLDADDWWESEKIERQIAELEKDDKVDLVYSDMCVHYDDGTTVPSFLKNRPLAASGYVFDKLIQSQFIFPSTVLIRRSCIQQVGMFDESMLSLEDCDLFLRICYTCRVAVVLKPLVHRRQRAGNMTSDEDLGTRYRIKFHEKALELPKLSPECTGELRRQLSVACFKRGAYCLDQRRIHECRSSLLLSLKHDWKNVSAVRCLMGSYLPPSLLAKVRNWRNWLKGDRFNPQPNPPSPDVSSEQG
jgi:glycosyltransferase involved in cell wall biosynthesis